MDAKAKSIIEKVSDQISATFGKGKLDGVEHSRGMAARNNYIRRTYLNLRERYEKPPGLEHYLFVELLEDMIERDLAADEGNAKPGEGYHWGNPKKYGRMKGYAINSLKDMGLDDSVEDALKEIRKAGSKRAKAPPRPKLKSGLGAPLSANTKRTGVPSSMLGPKLKRPKSDKKRAAEEDAYLMKVFADDRKKAAMATKATGRGKGKSKVAKPNYSKDKFPGRRLKSGAPDMRDAANKAYAKANNLTYGKQLCHK